MSELVDADALIASFGERLPLTQLPAGAYAAMRYPKLLPFMRFQVKRYAAAGFGNLFSMQTRSAGGLMRLSTLCFTPNCGTDVPLMLIDTMRMGNKRAAFVEYYDLTAARAAQPALEKVQARYAALPDYPEKPAWYVGERAPYSLIKVGADEAALVSMLKDSLRAYAEICAAATVPAEENRRRLGHFIDRMTAEGNPSSAVMERTLGKAGAEAFFRSAVMPASYTDH